MCQLMKQNGKSQCTWQNPRKALISELASIQGQKVCVCACVCTRVLAYVNWKPVYATNALIGSPWPPHPSSPYSAELTQSLPPRKKQFKKRRGLRRDRMNAWRKLKVSIGVGAPGPMKTLLNLAFGVPQPKGNFQAQVQSQALTSYTDL